MAGYFIEPGTLELIGQCAERQAGHLDAIARYLMDNTALTNVGGVVMACLRPQYDEGRDAALEGFTQGVTVCGAVAQRATQTRDAYAQADLACRDALGRAVAGTGLTLPPVSTSSQTFTLSTDSATDPAQKAPDKPTSVLPTGSDPISEEVRGGIDVTLALVGESADRVHPRPSSWVSDLSVGHVIDVAIAHGEDRFWAARERSRADPSATTTLRQDRENNHRTTFRESYAAGAGTTRAGSLTGRTEWSQTDMTERTHQAGSDIYDTVTSVQGAYGDVQTALTAQARADALAKAAEAPANTNAYNWAATT